MSGGHSKDFLFGIFGPTIIHVIVVEDLLHLSPGSDIVVPR